MIYVGLDPGLGGGIAGVDESGRMVRCAKMPITEAEILAELEAYKAFGPDVPFGPDVRAVLERASASPQMGVTSAFTFGRGYGGLTMALTAVRIPFDIVVPKTWQTALSCLSGGDKNVTKRRAQQLFPAPFTVTHANADALLIAEYCRRAARGMLRQPVTEGV